MERWTPTDPENEPEMALNISSGEFLATRENTRLYTHLGSLALYDHVFCSGEQTGFYIFSFVDGYQTMKEYMLENNYPAYINHTEAAQVDIDAYDRAVHRSVGDIDHIPDGWL